MAWDQLNDLKDLIPVQLIPAAALGLVGIAYAVARKESDVEMKKSLVQKLSMMDSKVATARMRTPPIA